MIIRFYLKLILEYSSQGESSVSVRVWMDSGHIVLLEWDYRFEGRASPFVYHYSYVNGVELSSLYQSERLPLSIINKEQAPIDKVEKEGNVVKTLLCVKIRSLQKSFEPRNHSQHN